MTAILSLLQVWIRPGKEMTHAKIFISLLLVLPTVSTYNLTCPHVSHWITRSLLVCNNTESYVCLWDEINDVYAEKCTGPKPDRPGYKYILNLGNFDRRFCSQQYFQPFLYSTQGSSRCIYQKFLCNGEGQVTVHNGSSTQNRRCRCDYNRGYAFVAKNTNPCFCLPSTEDCSCYIKQCGQGNSLSQDYICSKRSDKQQNYTCPLLSIDVENGYQVNTVVKTEEEKDIDSPIRIRWILGAVILLVSAIIVLFIVLIVLMIEPLKNDKQAYISVPLQNKVVREYLETKFVCQAEEEGVRAKWFKGEEELVGSDNILIEESEPGVYSLTIKETFLNDAGNYMVDLNGHTSEAKLDVKDTEEYKRKIDTENEQNLCIRVMIVGKNGVGKTCLLRRLLEEDIKGVFSTDGIEIVANRCKIRQDDGTWKIDREGNAKKDLIERIKRAYAEDDNALNQQKDISGKDNAFEVDVQEKTTEENPQNKTIGDNKKFTTAEYHRRQKDVRDNTQDFKDASDIIYTRVSTEQTKSDSYPKTRETTKSLPKPPQLTNVITEKVTDELKKFLLDIEDHKVEDGLYIDCRFWDFAGEKEYYATHQIFLNQNVVYLLVVDISQDFTHIYTENKSFNSISEYLDFWIDNIHAYGISHQPKDGNDCLNALDPPVLIVCTGIDKIEKSKLDDTRKAFNSHVNEIIGKEEKAKHIRNTYYLSNKDPVEEDYNHLKKDILKYGRKLESFSCDIPLKWVRLERSIEIVKESGRNILTMGDIEKLSTNCEIEDREELNKFLLHHHNIGNLIYFEDINDYVILSQQWLANAFRCLVTDEEKFGGLSGAWTKLRQSGELTLGLITELFNKDPDLNFNAFQNHILNVMDQFDILVNMGSKYYLPCMIDKAVSFDDLINEFQIMPENFEKSPWLCLEFKFMPILFFNQILVYFIRTYEPCTTYRNRIGRPAIYHGKGIFYFDDSKFQKIIVCFSKNTICIQIWESKPNTLPKGSYKGLLERVERKVSQLMLKYKVNLEYEVKAKCPDGNFQTSAGLVTKKYLNNIKGEFFCEEHCTSKNHKTETFFKTWFEESKMITDDNSRTERVFRGADWNDKKCDLCEERSQYLCVTCNQSMCKDCSTNHQTWEQYSDHDIKQIGIEYKLSYSFPLQGSVINDVKVLPDGLLVIADSTGKQLVTCNIKGEQYNRISLPDVPWSITVVDNNTVAVILYSDEIQTVDIRHRQIINGIYVQGSECIMYSNNRLFVGCDDHTIKVVSLSGEVIRTIDLGFTPVYICGDDKGNIYFIDYNNNKLHFTDNDLNSMFTFTSPDMRGPWGLTIDNEGYILVACKGSDNVHRISPDGSHSQIIISHIPSGWNPYICYDSVSQSVIIVRTNTIYVYKQK